MSREYEFFFLSDLLKKSRQEIHPDYQEALDFIWHRLDTLSENSPSSEFNRLIRWLKRIIPRSFLPILLYRFRYDACIGFHQKGEERNIYAMLTFQKHPRKGMIGMFDAYVREDRRNKDVVVSFVTIADLVYQLTQSFRKSGFQYIQCGQNRTTQKLLKLYKRVNKKKGRDVPVDIEKSRIYLDDEKD